MNYRRLKMLTKEEFEKIKRDIKYIYPEWTIPFISLMDILQNHVEKSDPPKRTIQVGDIYKDNRGFFEHVYEVNAFTLRTVALTDDVTMHEYTHKGEYYTSYLTSKSLLNNLDLSKCYKLVEREE